MTVLRSKQRTKLRRVMRNRSKVKKSGRSRLCVSRSRRYLYCQVIDDVRGVTVCAVHSSSCAKGAGVSIAAEVGTKIAELSLQLGISEVVFDRGACRYHGRVAACAEAARVAGLTF